MRRAGDGAATPVRPCAGVAHNSEGASTSARSSIAMRALGNELHAATLCARTPAVVAAPSGCSTMARRELVQSTHNLQEKVCRRNGAAHKLHGQLALATGSAAKYEVKLLELQVRVAYWL